ncbi:hypothetical protein H0H92_011343 [Tricholoma furcatifolium]|nr:hypothetical protein H0H92_011343 [Tricholoma furcatifolium]
MPSTPPSPPPATSLPPLPRSHPYQSFTPRNYSLESNSPTVPSSSHTIFLPESLREHPPSAYNPSRASFNGVESERSPSLSRRSSVTVKQYFVHHHHHHHHPPVEPQGPVHQQRTSTASTRPGDDMYLRLQQTRMSNMTEKPEHPRNIDTSKQLRRRLRKIHPVIWILAFLPIPPSLCVAYVLIGHSIIRRALGTSLAAGWSPSLGSSATAAAFGGSILVLPMCLVLSVLISLSMSVSGLRRARERGLGLGLELELDVLDDNRDREDPQYKSQVLPIATYIVCAIMFFGVGGAAAPLGVLCLTQVKGRKLGDDDMHMLSLGRAAEAGLLGAAVTVVGCLMLVFIVMLTCFAWRRNPVRREADPEKSRKTDLTSGGRSSS